jgi:hypothetical protein
VSPDVVVGGQISRSDQPVGQVLRIGPLPSMPPMPSMPSKMPAMRMSTPAKARRPEPISGASTAIV